MKILISGILGHMGREVEALCKSGYRGAELFGGVDPNADGTRADVYSSFDQIENYSEIDFVMPSAASSTGPAEREEMIDMLRWKKMDELIQKYEMGNLSSTIHKILSKWIKD